MSKNYDRAFEFLVGADAIIENGFQDQLRKVQEDMTAGLREAIEGGWMSQDEADQLEYDWMQRYPHLESPQ